MHFLLQSNRSNSISPLQQSNFVYVGALVALADDVVVVGRRASNPIREREVKYLKRELLCQLPSWATRGETEWPTFKCNKNRMECRVMGPAFACAATKTTDRPRRLHSGSVVGKSAAHRCDGAVYVCHLHCALLLHSFCTRFPRLIIHGTRFITCRMLLVCALCQRFLNIPNVRPTSVLR